MTKKKSFIAKDNISIKIYIKLKPSLPFQLERELRVGRKVGRRGEGDMENRVSRAQFGRKLTYEEQIFKIEMF